MFSDFRDRALNRKPEDRPERRRLTRTSKILATAGVLGVVTVVAIAMVVVNINNRSSSQTADQVDYYTASSVDYYSYGIHLDASDKIDKVYGYEEFEKLSADEREASDVIVFHDNNTASQINSSLVAPTTVTVDGVSHPLDVKFGANIDSFSQAVSTYNELVAQDATISLRGKQKVSSVEYYVLNIVTTKVNEALKSGAITSPTVIYDGTSTVFSDKDVATAYKAGIDANSLSSCPKDGTPCMQTTLKFEFSCNTIGVSYVDWPVFEKQVNEFMGVQSVRISDPKQGTLLLDTTDPCRVTSADPSYMPGNNTPPQSPTPPAPAPPVNEGGTNGPGDTGGF